MDTVKNIDEKTRNWGEILFFSFFIPWIGLVILSQTAFYGVYLYKYFSVWEVLIHFLPILFVSVKVLAFDKIPLIPKLLLLLGFFIVVAQFFNITFDDDLLLAAVLIFSSFGIDFKKILKIHLLESVIITLIGTISSLVGIIPNISYHKDGITRYALGSIWCTDYSAKYFFMILVCLYLYSKKMRWFHWIGLLALSSGVFAVTFGRLDFICMILAIAAFFLHEQLEKKDDTVKFKSIWKNLLEKLSPVFTPAAAVLMTLLTIAYSPSNSLLQKINLTLSRRLDLGKSAFSDIGFTAIGQDVKWVAMGGTMTNKAPEGYNFVDCSYLNILFTFGVLAILILIAAHAYMAYANRKDHRFVLVIALISLNCIVAHHFIEVAYNPFWAALLAITPVFAGKNSFGKSDTENAQKLSNQTEGAAS